MKIFLDANVLVAVLNKEIVPFTDCARVLSLADHKTFDIFTSPMCLAIAFYFSSKKHGQRKAKEKLALLSSKIKITQHHADDIELIMKNKKIEDLEDGLEYYSALASQCECLVSLDLNDFHFSDIPVLQPRDFLRRFVV